MRPPSSFQSLSESEPRVDFIGALTRRVDLAGFSLAEVRDVANVVVERHTHDDAHFCIVLGEGYRSSARGLDEPCGRGTLLYHPGGTTHEDHFLRTGGSFLVLKPASGEHTAQAEMPAISVAFDGPQAKLLCERIALEARREDLSSTLALECLYMELIGLVTDVSAHRHRPSWIDPVLEEIEDARVADLSVEALAARSGVHPVYLARAFRSHVGMSPGEVLRWFRLRDVLLDLANTDRSLADLALQAGFSDQSAFTRACRRMLGITPGVYRERMRSG